MLLGLGQRRGHLRDDLHFRGRCAWSVRQTQGGAAVRIQQGIPRRRLFRHLLLLLLLLLQRVPGLQLAPRDGAPHGRGRPPLAHVRVRGSKRVQLLPGGQAAQAGIAAGTQHRLAPQIDIVILDAVPAQHARLPRARGLLQLLLQRRARIHVAKGLHDGHRALDLAAEARLVEVQQAQRLAGRLAPAAAGPCVVAPLRHAFKGGRPHDQLVPALAEEARHLPRRPGVAPGRHVRRVLGVHQGAQESGVAKHRYVRRDRAQHGPQPLGRQSLVAAAATPPDDAKHELVGLQEREPLWRAGARGPLADVLRHPGRGVPEGPRVHPHLDAAGAGLLIGTQHPRVRAPVVDDQDVGRAHQACVVGQEVLDEVVLIAGEEHDAQRCGGRGGRGGSVWGV